MTDTTNQPTNDAERRLAELELDEQRLSPNRSEPETLAEWLWVQDQKRKCLQVLNP
jgi:hypothetical protein